jgi:hypothetical protein
VADGRLSVPQDAPSVEIARHRQAGRITCLAHHLFIGENDTVTDLADGFVGGATGGVFLGVWAMP